MIVENPLPAEAISPPYTTVWIYFMTDLQRVYVSADYFVALQAYNDGLRGDALVEALGGFVFP